eukprot:359972-Chlamydomonas_euryale.AAC.6
MTCDSGDAGQKVCEKNQGARFLVFLTMTCDSDHAGQGGLIGKGQHATMVCFGLRGHIMFATRCHAEKRGCRKSRVVLVCTESCKT